MASSIDKEAGSQSPADTNKPPRHASPGSDDLLILAKDDEFYWLKKEAYQTPSHQLPSSMDAQVKKLVSQGVVLADIPVGSVPGVGCMCYLVNLSGLRPRREGKPPPPDGRPVFNPPAVDPEDPCLRGNAPAFDDLVIFSRDGTTFYWVKKCEYQRTVCRLDQADPVLEEQLRGLAIQGVVLADVPGGTLTEVSDMGCLVNLSLITRLDTKQKLAERAAAAKEEEEP